MVAAFIYLAPVDEGGPSPIRSQLEEAMKAAYITYGIDEEGLGKLEEALAKGTKLKPLIPVARGELVVEPQDAEPEISFTFLTQAGLVRKDG